VFWEAVSVIMQSLVLWRHSTYVIHYSSSWIIMATSVLFGGYVMGSNYRRRKSRRARNFLIYRRQSWRCQLRAALALGYRYLERNSSTAHGALLQQLRAMWGSVSQHCDAVLLEDRRELMTFEASNNTKISIPTSQRTQLSLLQRLTCSCFLLRVWEKTKNRGGGLL
jgi:hypothetical protein